MSDTSKAILNAFNSACVRDSNLEETLRREFAELEKERDELKKRASATLGTVCRLMSDGEELEQERDNLRAALDAADRFAKMVKQYAEGSIVTLGDIGQEYEFYQAARALVGKAGGGE